MATKTSKSLSAAGAALLACAALSPAALAADNPFQMTELPAGYQLADAHGGKDGEGKCGEGKCGEGKCGEEGDPGAKADSEGKCGEGKCGAMDDAE